MTTFYFSSSAEILILFCLFCRRAFPHIIPLYIQGLSAVICKYLAIALGGYGFVHQTPVVQMMDSAIRPGNQYPLDNWFC